MPDPYRVSPELPEVSQLADPVRTAQALLIEKVANSVDALTCQIVRGTNDNGYPFGSVDFTSAIESLRRLYEAVAKDIREGVVQ